MRPVILILETRPEVAEALEEVVTSARYAAVVRPHLECLSDLETRPAAIIVRISFEGLGEPQHAVIARLSDRPPVVAIAWEQEEIAEALRLRCEVILKAPAEIGRLCDALSALVSSAAATVR